MLERMEVYPMLHDTLQIIRIIGSPLIKSDPPNLIYKKNEIKHLLRIADTNKIHLFYIESMIKLLKECPQLRSIYSAYRQKYQDFLSWIMDIAKILNDSGIQYAVFKTLKPFPVIPSDADLLAFEDKGLNKANHLLKMRGYKILKVGPNSVTLKNPKLEFKIDMHKEIAVSHLIYMDKHELENYLKIKYIGGLPIVVFSQEVDTLISMNHSIYKEQIYTLADFYSILYTLSGITKKQYANFIELTKTQKSKLAVLSTLAFTTLLHKMAFNYIPSDLIQLYAELAPKTCHFATNYEVRKLLNSKDLPHKFSPITVTAAILAKLQYPRTRRNFPKQLKAFLKASFFRDFSEQIWQHIKHGTY